MSAHEDRLVREGLVLLEVVARRLDRRLGGLVRTEDLIASGRVAVLEIVRAYEPERASFAPYCAQRLKWALLDAVRRDTHGRVAKLRARALSASERYAEGYSEHDKDVPLEPTEEAAEARLGTLLSGHAAALALGLVAATAELDDEPSLAPSPEAQYVELEFSERLRAIVVALPARERTLIERHYWDDVPLEHVARELGVSKSWASRLHAQVVEAIAREVEKL